MPSDRHTWKRVRPEILVPLVVLVLVALAIWLAVRNYLIKPTTSGDALDIQLVGVRPDCGDLIMDAMGEELGEQFYDLTYDHAWGTGRMRRDFIFEIGDTNTAILAPWYEVVSPDQESFRSYGKARLLSLPDGRQRLVAQTTIAQTISRQIWRWFWRSPVRRVNVRLHYFLRQPGTVASRFEGPFPTDKTIALTNGITLTPGTNWTEHDNCSAQFQLHSLRKLSGVPFPVIAVDAVGKRHPVQRLRSTPAGTNWDYACRVPDVPLEDIAALQVETPREKTFHNLRVYYPDHPVLPFPAYKEKVVNLLGWTRKPDQFQSFNFRNTAEALRVVESVRGSGVRDVVKALLYNPSRIPINSLPNEDRQRLRLAANNWARTFGLRVEGINVGLNGQWPEFVGPALELLADDSRAGDSAITWALSRHPALLAESDVSRIEGILLTARPWTEIARLTTVLASNTSPRTLQILLRLAVDERPWIWWRAVESLESLPLLGKSNPPPDWLLQRLFLVQGQTPVRYGGQSIAVPVATVEKAYQLVPAWMTPELQQRDGAIFFKMYEHLIQHCPPEQATDLFLNLLQPSGCRPQTKSRLMYLWMRVRMIQQLNQWHGLNIGPWGNDPEIHPQHPIDETALHEAIRKLTEWHSESSNRP